jgi:hypothetical protein
MGKKCSEGGRPKKFSLLDLQDLDVGDQKQMGSGCGPHSGDHMWFLKKHGMGWPENGEFGGGDFGSTCDLCPEEYGCDCARSGLIGKRGKVKRHSFLADPAACCMANTGGEDSVKILGEKTCDPKYRRPNLLECRNIYKKNCTGNRILNDECKKLKNNSNEIHMELMGEYCNSSKEAVKTQECIEWCNVNVSNCTKAATMTACESYGIPEADCSEKSVLDLRTECRLLDIESDIGQAMGSYKCARESIKELKEACKQYKLVGRCSSIGLDQAMANEISIGFAEESKAQYENTLLILNNALGETPSVTAGSSNSSSDFGTIFGNWFGKYTTWIIMGIILLVCCCSSSISASLAISSGKAGKAGKVTSPEIYQQPNPPAYSKSDFIEIT